MFFVFVYVWYSIDFKKLENNTLSLPLSLHNTYVIRKRRYKESGDWHFVTIIPRYIYIHKLYKYILYGCEWGSCKNWNSLARYQRYIEEPVLRALLSFDSFDCSTILFRVEYLSTQSITPHVCAGSVHAPPLSGIYDLTSLSQSAIRAAPPIQRRWREVGYAEICQRLPTLLSQLPNTVKIPS